jgi:hypothetical protein
MGTLPAPEICVRCRFFGPLDNGAIPVFDKSELEPDIPWVLDSTLMWTQVMARRVILPLNEVTVTAEDWQTVLDRDNARLRRINERFLWKHLRAFVSSTSPFDDEGIFTIVHRNGSDGMLGLAWSAFPLIPSERYCVTANRRLKKEFPPWWNALV